MTKPTSSPPDLTPDQLAAECIELVHRLRRHRLNVRLLLSAREMLRRSLGYKGTRPKTRHPRGP